MKLLDYKPRLSLHLFALHAEKITGTPAQEIYSRCVLALQAYKRNDERASDDIFGGLTRWYGALENGEIDYGVYEGVEYLPEGWACWVEYSRSYLRNIQSPKSMHGHSIVDDMSPVGAVLDLGCGFGYTTTALRQMFPEAKVVGTNFPGSIQWKIAADLGSKCGFTMAADIDDIDWPIDLVFASEFFEHLPEPIDYLRKVLDLKPKALLVANAFGARAIGHFLSYRIEGKVCDPKETSRAFAAEMKSRGYVKHKTKLWNNRPAYWRLS